MTTEQPKYCDTTSMPSMGELEVWARKQLETSTDFGNSSYWTGFHDAVLVICQQKRLEDCP